MYLYKVNCFIVKPVLITALICIASLSEAQLYRKFELITKRNGLSDNRVTCFHKDKTGFLWVGTKSGLNRYDGQDFTHFKPKPANSISNEIITSITEDRSGRIWVGTMNGLNSYDPLTDTWRNYAAEGNYVEQMLTNPIVWSCYADERDNIWIATDRTGLSVLGADRKLFRHYNWRQYVHEIFPELKGQYFSVIKMIPKNDNEILLASTIGLFVFNKQTGAFKIMGESVFNNDIQDFQYNPENGKAYITDGIERIFCFDEKANKAKKLIPEPLVYPSVTFSAVENNRIWIGTKSGLLLADKKTDKVFLMKHISQVSASVPPGGVNTVFHDNTGISWVAANNGIAKYDRNGESSFFLPLLPTSDKEGMNPMSSAYYDSTSNSYFVCSSESSEVYIIKRTEGKIDRITTDASGKKFISCNSISVDNEKNIWLLTNNHVYKFNRSTKKFILFPTPNNGSEIVFRDMVQDPEGNYWFAGFHGPLYFYSSKEKKFTTTGNKDAFNDVRKATSLLTDGAAVWIGTFSNGLYRFDLKAKEFILYNEQKNAKHYAGLNLVNDLHLDKTGTVWVATYSGGLFVSQKRQPYEKTFAQITMKDGLESNNQYALASDDSIIWAASGKGISVLNTNSQRVVHELSEDRLFPFTSFSSENHLPHYIDFNTHQKELLLAVNGGLMIYSNAVITKSSDFPVLLTSLKANNKLYEDSLLNKTGTSVKFDHPLKEIEIGFAALHYTLPAWLVFEYKLAGFDEDWKSQRIINSVAYQNLQPGSYTFYLRAKDANGNLSPQQAQFSFTVIPPFWKTWWFRSLVGAFISLMIYAWISRLRRKVWVEKKLNYFATSLYGQNTLDEIAWNISTNSTGELNFDSLSIYLYDETKNSLIQKAAALKDEKVNKHNFNAAPFAVKDTLFEEMVKTRKPAKFASKNRFIASKLIIPVEVDGKIYAVIEAGHTGKNYFKKYHEKLLMKLAEICAAKISKYNIEERLRSKIARDLHDEIGSTLTSINIISKVAMQQQVSNETISGQLKKIKDNSHKAMDSMSDMVWAINPANDSFARVVLKMREFAAELLEPAGINYGFKAHEELQQISLNAEQRKNIYLIFKEAVNNAAKYSGCTEVVVFMHREKQVFIMSVTDNGCGFNIDTQSNGNGLQNMRHRAFELGAQLHIHSGKFLGTSVSLTLPITLLGYNNI